MPVIALFVLSLLWGSTFYFTKLLLPAFHPVSIVCFRCLFGALMLLPFFIAKKGYKELTSERLPLLVGIALLSAGVPWTIMSLSLLHLDTTAGAVLNATGPIFGVLITLLLLKGQVNKQELMGVAVGFAGICLVLLWKPSAASFHAGSAGLLLLAVCLYALSAVLTGKFLRSYSVITLSFVTMAAGTLFAAPLMLLVQPSGIPALTNPQPVLYFFMLGALNSGIGNLLYYYIVKAGGPIFALSITYLMPLMTILLGVFLLQEPVNAGTLLALGFVLSSIYISQRKDGKQ